jgi:hypothetical protein
MSSLRQKLARPSAAEWFILFVGLFLTLRYAWLLDDAFIYFRYVDNLLYLDRGLVYNSGEYVEGFSSPLWTLLLIALRSIGLDYWWITRIVALLAYAGFWAMAVALHRRMLPPGAPRLSLALAFLAFNYPVLCYFSSGMETVLVQLSAAIVALHVLWPRSRPLQLCVGLLPLARPEQLLAVFVLVAAYLWRERRIPWVMIFATLAFNGAYEIFRISYYAELFPNTYHLKNLDDPIRGLRYLRQFAVHSGWGVVTIATVLFGALLYRRTRPERRYEFQLGSRGIMIVAALPGLLYAIKIGGDFAYYRYLAFPVCLCVLSGSAMLDNAAAGLRPGVRRTLEFGVPVTLAVTVGLLLPPQLEEHPLWSPTELSETPISVDGVYDANSHRRHPDLAFSPWTLESVLDQRERYHSFLELPNSDTHLSFTVTGWCVDNFKEFETHISHRWGLTDPILARLDLPQGKAGHALGMYLYATHLASIRRFLNADASVGMLGRAEANGRTLPDWVLNNQDTLAQIERRMYNRHRPLENLRAALTPIPRIDVSAHPENTRPD